MTTMAAWNNAMHASRTCVALLSLFATHRLSKGAPGNTLQRFGGSKGGCRFVSSSAVQEQERRPDQAVVEEDLFPQSSSCLGFNQPLSASIFLPFFFFLFFSLIFLFPSSPLQHNPRIFLDRTRRGRLQRFG
ncbi:hypothetical protein J3E69DRAFT_51947 [Trichoderma sp. SZMC 28015]